jgi:hypothetical protein
MSFFSLLLNNGEMKTINEIHRKNLQALVAEFGTVAAVAELIGCSSSQYSQWLTGSKNSGTGKPRGLGPNSARRIEKACGKLKGWMDADHEVGTIPHIHSVPPREGALVDTVADATRLACESAGEIRTLIAYRLATLDDRQRIDDLIDDVLLKIPSVIHNKR